MEEEATPNLRLNLVEAQEQASVDLLQAQADSEEEVAGLEVVSVAVIEVGSVEEDSEEVVASGEVEVASREAEVVLMEEEVATVLVVAALATKATVSHLMARLQDPEVGVASVEVEDQVTKAMTVVTMVSQGVEAMVVPLTKEELLEATWSQYDLEETGMVTTAAMATEDRPVLKVVTCLWEIMEHQIVVNEMEVTRERESMMAVTKSRERELTGIDRMVDA